MEKIWLIVCYFSSFILYNILFLSTEFVFFIFIFWWGKAKSFYLLHYNDFSFFGCVIWRKVFYLSNGRWGVVDRNKLLLFSIPFMCLSWWFQQVKLSMRMTSRILRPICMEKKFNTTLTECCLSIPWIYFNE